MELEILVFSYITVEINEFSHAAFYCNSYCIMEAQVKAIYEDTTAKPFIIIST